MEGFGVPAAKVEIADFGGRRTLIVERFDRRWTKDARLLRLPQEDCCQALSVPPTRKYQSDGGPGMREVIDLLKGSDTPDTDITTFMSANIIFWLLGATDGHAKNFSVFITPGGRFRMTPAYDVLTAQPSLDAGQISRKKFKLAMSVGKNRHYDIHEIMPRHFLQTADLARIGLPAVRSIIENMGEVAPRKAAAVIEALPQNFPGQLIDSVMRAINERSRLLSEFNDGAVPT
jgi:serine/threonine-protein kinase HipA